MASPSDCVLFSTCPYFWWSVLVVFHLTFWCVKEPDGRIPTKAHATLHSTKVRTAPQSIRSREEPVDCHSETFNRIPHHRVWYNVQSTRYTYALHQWTGDGIALSSQPLLYCGPMVQYLPRLSQPGLASSTRALPVITQDPKKMCTLQIVASQYMYESLALHKCRLQWF